jgi:hypothetical protein
MRRHAAGLIHPGNGALRFQIEMLLSADPQFTIYVQRAGLNHRRISPSQPQRSRVKTFGQNCVFDAKDGGKRLAIDRYFARATLRRIQSFAQNPCHGLAVVCHLGWEQRFVVPVGSRIALARNVRDGKNSGDSRFRQGRRNIQRLYERMRMRRKHRPGMQRARKTEQQIVGIKSVARHMIARAFMRDRLSGYRSGHLQAAASRRSHRNLATKLLATASL